MYVRIARFEDAEGDWDQRIEDVRGQMVEGMRNRQDEVPVKRSLMLVDRAGGRGASVMFCEGAEDLRKVDEYMNSMTPPAGAGRRTSVEMYEVALDSDEL
ncbi:MAG TPA: hypothetical protein VFJ75_05140 [Gaiellaceae bacterium]|nr:hypothetical protein [Gaiellaceae bacterium]